MESPRPLFYLIDGHAVAYRQYFGLPVDSFTTRTGEKTNAIYGFTRILLDMIQKIKPHYLAVAFDMGLSGRDDLYGEYKGTREKMPEDLASQLDRINEVVKALNIPILAVEGYEADDVIGTVARQIEAEGIDTRIVTGDRDLLQLLNEHVTVQLPTRSGPDEVFDVARFVEKYEIQPDQLVDFKALKGDTSDNIPGVAGIGDKTATQLLLTYQTLDGIYANLEQLKGAVKTKLMNGREMAYLSHQLAKIQQDVPIQINLPACVAHDFDSSIAIELFQELEFRTFSDRLAKEAVPTTTSMFEDEDFGGESDEDFAPPPVVDCETIIVRDETQLQALVEVLNNAQGITWDVETTGKDQMQAELVGISVAADTERGYYIPVGHKSGKQLPLQKVLDALQAPMENPDIPKYAHNANYDLVMMQRYGVNVSPVVFDTMIAEWMRDPISKFLGLKNLSMHALRTYMTPITDLIGTGKKQKTMDVVAIELAAPYAVADAVVTHRLVEYLRPILVEQGLDEIFSTLEIPLIPVIATMEQAGVTLDIPYLAEMSERLAQHLHDIEQSIYDLTKEYGVDNFNINSPKQLNEVLFDKLGLPVQGIKKTTHGYSTDAATLEKLAEDTNHPIVARLLEFRELTKLKGTYVDALPVLVNPQTGRVHTSYNQAGSATGRLSSSDPNLQNIPIRTEIGREVRRAFIAPQGKRLLSVDYSQIELRVMAHISRDETLLDAFAQGLDIHAATAAAVYGIPLESVTKEQRNFAKRVNFGLIYGMGAFRLARDSDLTLAEANAFIKTYFERLPGVEKYINDTKRKAHEGEPLSTLFGRKRSFMTSQNADRQAIQAEERAAINMPIQGTAADIMKQAMIDVHHALIENKSEAKMILQVHDELVLEVPENQVKETRDLVVHIMEAAYQMDAPLKANAQAGTNWRDMEEI